MEPPFVEFRAHLAPARQLRAAGTTTTTTAVLRTCSPKQPTLEELLISH